MRFFLLLFLHGIQLNVAQAELGKSVGSSSAQTSQTTSCTAAQKEENQSIIDYCNDHWNTWGIKPIPSENELRKVDECSGLFSSATASGCVDSLVSLPIFLLESAGDMAAVAAVSVITTLNEDKTSQAYIFQNGTSDEVSKFLTNQFLRERCRLGPQDESLVNEECPSHQVGVGDQDKQECRNAFVQKFNAAKNCHTSKETRSAYRSWIPEMNAKTQEVLRNREVNAIKKSADQAAASSYSAELLRIKRKCTPKIVGGSTILLFQIADRMRDNGFQVQSFNACVKAETNSNLKLKNELLKRTEGWISQALGEMNSLQCYNERERRELQCQIATSVMTGGAGLALAGLKRLGHRTMLKLQEKGIVSDVKQAAVTNISAPASRSSAKAGGGAVNPIEASTSATTVAAPSTPSNLTLKPQSTAMNITYGSRSHIINAYRTGDFSGDLRYLTLKRPTDGTIQHYEVLGKTTNGHLTVRFINDKGVVQTTTINASILRNSEISSASKNAFINQFNGQSIEVISKTGEKLEGLSHGLINLTDGTQVLRVTNRRGKEELLDISNLEVSTLTPRGTAVSKMGYEVTQDGRILGVSETVLGGQIKDFEKITDLKLYVANTSSRPMNLEYYLDADNGRVIINPSLKNNSKRIEELLNGEIANAVVADRTARANLNRIHGISVNKNGVLQVVNPKTQLGRMIASLEKKHGVKIRLHDPEIDEINASGLSFSGTNEIAIARNYFMGGREKDLEALLRHEVKHNTNDTGLVRYPTASSNSHARSSAGLHYAGENIQFIPAGPQRQTLMERSGVHSIYKDGHRADEMSARVTQFPPQRVARAKDQVAENYSQHYWVDQIIRNNLQPKDVLKNWGGKWSVRYEVKGAYGDAMILDVPLTGLIKSEAQAKELARQVIEYRLKYLNSHGVMSSTKKKSAVINP